MIDFNDPTSLPPAALGLELVVVAGAVLTLVHALRARRAGDRSALFTWATIFVYGVTMELVSYNFVDNFTHAQFTVMFYGRKLPLYVTAVYPVLLYTGILIARRLRLGPAAEPFAAGLFIVMLDVPFDLLGPVAGWWSWSDRDPNIAYRWLGVPVTSYYWHLAFGGCLAAVTRFAGRLSWRLPYALPAAAVTIVMGFVSFFPFHGIKALGRAIDPALELDGAIVAALIAAAALVTLRGRKDPIRGVDPLLASVAAGFVGFHLVVAVSLAAS